MSPISIVPCESTRKSLKEFVLSPWKIYRPKGKPSDKNWVPPLIQQQIDLLDPKKNPFFLHSETQCFLAKKDGETVGRIAAIWNNNHNKLHNENVGFFGFFDCINDQEVANALLKRADEWVAERGGIALRGPTNLTTNDECGFLVKGFDSPPYMGLTYNPEYYLELINKAGFQKSMDLYSYYLDASSGPQELLEQAAKAVAEEEQLTKHDITKKNFDEMVGYAKDIYNKSWEKNWGFVPLTEEEFAFHVKELKQVMIPDFCFVIFSKGEPIGWSMTLPNYNEVLIKLNGRLTPWGIIKFLYYKRKIETVRVFTLGLLPEYQHKGIALFAYWHTMLAGLKTGITRGEMSWVLESNLPMRKGIEQVGGNQYKTYRIFERPITN
ncbi:N-acetyltransferase [Bdellovibrionota bacterium]